MELAEIPCGVGPFLTQSELLALGVLDRGAAAQSASGKLAFRGGRPSGPLAEAFRRLVACLHLQRSWRRLRSLRWIDDVAATVPELHAFPHRLETNLAALLPKFRGGIRAIPRIVETRRFLCRSAPTPLCPRCGTYAVRGVVYQQLGEKMARSSPHLFFGCAPCCDDYASDPWNGEYSLLRWTFLEDASWRRPSSI